MPGLSINTGTESPTSQITNTQTTNTQTTQSSFNEKVAKVEGHIIKAFTESDSIRAYRYASPNSCIIL